MIFRALAVLSLAAHACAAPDVTPIEAPSLERPVRIEIDELGVPRIIAPTREGAVYALGFMHGRDRFFQLDVSRRMASGRLSELAGAATLGMDKDMRRWDFQRVAHEIVERLEPDQRRLLESYVEGVNRGLASLAAPPPEYLFMGATPEPWDLESSALVTLALVDQLSHSRWSERWHDAAKRTFNDNVYAFLHPLGGEFDAPLEGGPAPLAPVPTPDDLDFRTALDGWPEDTPEKQSAAPTHDPDAWLRGSNNWAVASGRSVHDSAILASDPHLELQLPNVWYRAEMRWGSGDDERFTVGITLPGFPVVVMGSNGHLAWGMTNVHGDFEDSVVVPEGYRYTERVEEFRVRGQEEPTTVTYRDTEWGPVVLDEDHFGRTIASKWTGQMPEANDFAIFDAAEATTLEEGLDVAASWMSAPQNIVVACEDGRIGWAVSGYLPERTGFDGTIPAQWKEGEVGWAGQIPEEDRPRLIRDVDGMIYTANNRVAGLEQSQRFGTWFPEGVRAHRIRELLSAERCFDERDMLAIQLDTRTASLDRARDLILEIVPEDTDDPALREARLAAAGWTGHADPDDRGHVLIRTFAWRVRDIVWEPFVELVQRTDPWASRGARYSGDTAFRLLKDRPAHLLSPRYDSWDELVLDAIRSAAVEVKRAHASVRPRWGDVNRAAIQHPIAQIMGPIMPGLSAPADELPGDFMSVRVAGPDFGASMRLVVSPGHEEEGILHMPGGQSGIPGDPNFLSQHRAWVAGEPTPLLPGEPVEVLVLTPAEAP